MFAVIALILVVVVVAIVIVIVHQARTTKKNTHTLDTEKVVRPGTKSENFTTNVNKEI